MATKNARFWTFINGADVKLTLRKGDSLMHSVGYATDEGWKRETRIWEFNGYVVVESIDTLEKDCDGRMDHYSEYESTLEDLQAGPEIDGTKFPNWEEVRSRQRDHSAEAAGY
jgi:hypothetical protein